MTDTSKIEEDHKLARERREASIRSTPLRSSKRTLAPSSAHVVLEAKEWYRGFAKLALYALVGVAFCAAMISIALAAVTSRPPETLSYLMDRDGRVVQLQSERRPTLTETQVLNWAAKRMKAIHTLTFTDYVDHVQSLRGDFTPEAFDNYQRALLASKNLEKVKNERLVMWAEPISAPRITQAKVINGKYTWVIEMHINQYMGGGEFVSSATPIKGIMVVERTSRARNLAGIVISKYLAKEQGI